MEMQFTGERYVPQLLSAKISYEHWHRYIFASHFCQYKRVLDVASGEGYGSDYLAKFAAQVTGVDISAEAVSHAASKYSLPNLSFVESSASALPFENGAFDVIVSFETLEHLAQADQMDFLNESARLLQPDGLLIISTPNKKVYSDDANYSNPYHLSEFYKEDFESFLKKQFDHVFMFEQEIIMGSRIGRSNESFFNVDKLHADENGFFPGEAPRKKEKEYLIAICSKTKFPFVTGSIMLDDDGKMVQELSKA